MWLVIAEPGDKAGLWAYAGLGRLGLAPLEIVTMDELVMAPRWIHQLDDEHSHTRIELHDGRVIDSAELRGVLNRAVEPGSPTDGPAADFAQMEMRALLVSWLSSLACPVIDPPASNSLAGTACDPWSWQRLAHLHGVPAEGGPVGRVEPRDGEVVTALVVGDRCFGAPLGPELEPAVVALAAVAHAPILQLWFRRHADGLRLITATTRAELRLGGEPGLAAIRELLEGGWPA